MPDMKPLILVTQRFDSQVLALAQALSDVQVEFIDKLTPQHPLLAQAQALIVRSSQRIDSDFISAAPQLRFLITATSGFDHLDLSAAEKKGVRCFHTPQAQVQSAAEMTLLLILATQRQMRRSDMQMRSGVWRREELIGRTLVGQQLGIVGLGRVGQKVAEMARVLGLQVVAYDPYLQDPLPWISMLGYEELMRTSDIVSLHVPQTARTRHMIKKETLSWMDPESTLINMSRGDVVLESDLIDQLMKYPHFSAGLDVYQREPLAKDSLLLKLTNVVLSPHIGATTREALKSSSQMALDKAIALLKGESVGDELPPQALWYNE